MRTSAAGSDALRRPVGFTLIELLVVIVLIALLTSLVALALPRGREQAMQTEADRLAALLDAARAQAAARGVPLAWVPGPAGYSFEQPSQQGWVTLQRAPLVSRAWQWIDDGAAPGGAGPPRGVGATVMAGEVQVRVEGGGGVFGASPGWLVFGTEAVNAPMAVVLDGRGLTLTIASDGVKPFTVGSAR